MGRSPGGRFAEDEAALLVEARFQAIERIAHLAAAEQVDAVLVAGDVFDAQTVSDRTIHRLFQCLAGFSGPWILIPGNHDAALAESVWTRAHRLNAIPANARVLLQPQPVIFADAGFVILPAPLTQRQTHQDLTAWFDAAETPPGLLRIGLAHGSVQGQLPEAADSPNPIAPDRAQTAHLDYLALGDWHGAKQIDSRTWYSGTPEQERFKDNGAGQVLLVDIDQPGAQPQVQPRSIGQHLWLKRDFSLAVATDLDHLLAELQSLPGKSVVDLTLRGQLNLHDHERLQLALGAQRARHISLQTDMAQLHLVPTDDDIAALHADGYVGEVIATLQQQQNSGAHAEIARDALAILADLLRRQQSGEMPA